MIDLSKLPPAWLRERVEELCAFNPKHDKEISDDLEVSFVPMAVVDDTTNTIQAHEYKPLGEVKKGYTHFADGDIIFAKITPCMENGKSTVARYLRNGLACGSTEFHVLRSYGGIAPDYLHYFLRQEWYLKIAAKAMTGTVGQRRLPKEFLLNTEIPIPPHNEQRRIVAKIEALKARTQRVKEELEPIPTLLNQFRQSVLAAAFRGDLTADWRENNPDVEPASVLLEWIRAERRHRWEEAELEKMKDQGKTPNDNKWKAKYREPVKPDFSRLPKLPKRWIWASWDEVSNWVTYGFTRPMPHVKDGIPIVTAKNVLNNKIDIDSTHKTTEESFISLSDKDRPQPGDILITKDGTIGRAAIVTQEGLFCINQSVAVVWLRSCPIDRKYLLALIESPLTQKPIWEKVRGNAIQHLSITDFAKMAFPLPPLDEQNVIVEQLTRSLSTTENLAQAVEQNLKQIESLNQSILAKAFRGELVPQDPNDEPASVLLERIRAERAKLEATTKVVKKSNGQKSETKTGGQRTKKPKQDESAPKQLKLPGF